MSSSHRVADSSECPSGKCPFLQNCELKIGDRPALSHPLVAFSYPSRPHTIGHTIQSTVPGAHDHHTKTITPQLLPLSGADRPHQAASRPRRD